MTHVSWIGAREVLCVCLDARTGLSAAPCAGVSAAALMCTPAMRALRAQHPERRLTLLAAPAEAALAPYLVDADEVIACDAPWMNGGALRPGEEGGWIATLAVRRFDAAVVFACFRQSALPAAHLCRLAGIPLRLAYCRENPYPALSDWIADPEPGAMLRHGVQRRLDLVRHIGAEIADESLSFTPAQVDLAAMRNRLRQAGVAPDGRWLLLHPVTQDAHRWQEWTRALAQQIGCPLVVSGAAQERGCIAQIDPAGALAFAGQLHIGELGALLAQASLLVTDDSGASQLAAALGTPVVDLGTPDGPQYGPWRVPARVPSLAKARWHDQPGIPNSLQQLDPRQVVDAVRSLLKQTEAERREDMRQA